MQLHLPFVSVIDDPEILYVRMRRARRYVLRVRPDGRIRLTIPRGGSKAEGRQFLEKHRAWIDRERSRLSALRADRPLANPVLERACREQAKRQLPPRVVELARAHGLEVARVSIRNQRSRWGSCSRSGHISLNFRLVQMPAEVRDYIIIHELMHLREHNHSRRFWRHVEAACPSFRDAERWLKSEGRRLFS